MILFNLSLGARLLLALVPGSILVFVGIVVAEIDRTGALNSIPFVVGAVLFSLLVLLPCLSRERNSNIQVVVLLALPVLLAFGRVFLFDVLPVEVLGYSMGGALYLTVATVLVAAALSHVAGLPSSLDYWTRIVMFSVTLGLWYWVLSAGISGVVSYVAAVGGTVLGPFFFVVTVHLGVTSSRNAQLIPDDRRPG